MRSLNIAIPGAMRILYNAESEHDFQQKVVDYALLRGWMVHHILDTRIPAKRMGQPGFPDLMMCKTLTDGETITLAVELKSEKGKLSSAQKKWLGLLGKTRGILAFVWRPSHWERVVEILNGDIGRGR